MIPQRKLSILPRRILSMLAILAGIMLLTPGMAGPVLANPAHSALAPMGGPIPHVDGRPSPSRTPETLVIGSAPGATPLYGDAVGMGDGLEVHARISGTMSSITVDVDSVRALFPHPALRASGAACRPVTSGAVACEVNAGSRVWIEEFDPYANGEVLTSGDVASISLSRLARVSISHTPGSLHVEATVDAEPVPVHANPAWLEAAGYAAAAAQAGPGGSAYDALVPPPQVPQMPRASPFLPNLDDLAYAQEAGGNYYDVLNAGVNAVWQQGLVRTGPMGGHSGEVAWGTTLTGFHPPDAEGTLRVRSFNIPSGTTTATLSAWVWYQLEPGRDSLQVKLRQDNGTALTVAPTTGDAYSTLVDGASGWTGASAGWRQVTFNLAPYAGHVVDVDFVFHADALTNLQGAFVDDVQLTLGSALVLNDDMEDRWLATGGWKLGDPATGPQGGFDGPTSNAWAVAPNGPYAASLLSQLTTPPISLSGTNTPVLSLKSWLKTEFYHDRAYVEVSTDDGASWDKLTPSGATPYADLADGAHGWSGNTLGWTSPVFDLAPYKGSTIRLRFTFASDDSISGDGWYLSNVRLEDATPPSGAPGSFASFATSTDGFHAYFQSAGTKASFTTPGNVTVTVTYIGTAGDVVAKLAPNGTVTARRALVGLGGPIAVPASDFTVTNGNFTWTPAPGTWVVRGAPTATGVGGVQLKVGGKVFDNVASASEPIDGNGLGRLSANNLAAASWNWHNQAAARHDATAVSGSIPQETSLDARFTYALDADKDGFSDKRETTGLSNLVSPTSTPWRDDDGDGIPNMLETSRAAATDPFLVDLNQLVNQGLQQDDRYLAAGHTATAQLGTSFVADYDGDGINDAADFANEPGEGLAYVEADPAQNKLSITTTREGRQIAVLITPDFKRVMLIAFGGTASSQGAVTYDEFFTELAAYEQAHLANGVGSVDQMLTRVLRSTLDPTMTFYLTRQPATSGPSAPVSLAILEGTPGDGTWVLVRDTDLAAVTLTVDGISLTDSHATIESQNLAVLKLAWSFMNVHSKKSQCLTYNVFYREAPCSSHPSQETLRAYTREGADRMRGLLAILRDEYREASLLPGIYELVRAATKPDPEGVWGPQPASTQTTSGATSLSILGEVVAIADHGVGTPRTFEWDFRHFAPDPRFTGFATTVIGLEPTDGSHAGTSLLIKGSALVARGHSATANLTVHVDEQHRENSTVTRADHDGDGLLDYLVWVPHFSKAWVTVSNSGLSGLMDISMASSTRGYAVASPANYGVYDAAKSPAWQTYALPSPYASPAYTLNAVHALSATEAWLAGGKGPSCPANNCRGFVARVTYNGGTPSAQVWSYTQLSPLGDNYQIHDIHAIAGNDVWAAGSLGLFHWDGSSWTNFAPGMTFKNVQMRSSSDGFAIRFNGGSPQELWRWNGLMWTNTGSPPIQLEGSPKAGAFQVSRDGTAYWMTNGFRDAAYWLLSCTCWTTVTAADNYYEVVHGFSGNDAWFAGENGALQGATKHYGYGQFKTPLGDVSSGGIIHGIDFLARNEGWIGGSNGMVFRYAGANAAPTASFTATPTSVTTTQTVSVDAAASSDGDNDPLQYTWDWGDRSTMGIGATGSHRYRDAGDNIPLQLTVMDPDGSTSTMTRSISVSYAVLQQDVPLTMSFDAPGQEDYYQFTVPGNDLLRITLTGPEDSNFDVYARRGAKPTTSAYDLASTGANSNEDARLPTPTAGTYYVMVRSAMGTGSYTVTAGTYVKPSPPTVTQTPNPVNKGQTFTLTGASTTGSNVYYTAKWNDGTADSRDPTSGTKPPSSPYSFSHSFGTDGNFQVNVSATDAHGLSSWAFPSVIVRDPPSGATDPATNVAAHGATLKGNVGDLGGYSHVQVWFQYGLDTNYGSNTPAQTRTTGPASAGITGLASGTTYHYRIAIQNPLGTFTGGDQEFKTPNNAPGAPTISQSATVTSRNEAFYVTGSATDQNGDNVRYNISWGDGTWNLYPSDGSSVPSGTAYNVSHTYTSYGVKTVTVTARDVSGSPVDVSNWATHTVADPPAGTTNAPTAVGRATATFEGSVTNVGGDPAGVQAWFEYGPSGSFPWTTSKVVRTTTGAVSIPVSGLNEGATYNYRLVLQNVRAATTTAALGLSTNARPILTAAEPFTPYALEGGKFSFVLAYTDAQNEAPAPGYPRVVIDNSIVMPLSRTNMGDNTYTDGTLYAGTWTSTSGTHTYKYETRDAVPETLTTSGLYAQLRVNRTVEFRDPIAHAPGAAGQPPAGWYTDTLAPGSQCWGGTDSPFWHTVDTPPSGLVQNAPDRTVKDGASVSLWFGTDSGPGAGTYSNGQSRACGRVVSPEVSLAGDPSPALRFWSYFETEDDGDDNDLKRVYVQDALGLQTLLLTLSKPTHGSKGWMPVSTSLKAFAGKEVRLVFEFDSRDGLNNANAGWFINELVVGHDTDLDGIPDAAEAVDVASGRWTSADSGFVQSPSSKARLGGIQSSYAVSAQSEVIVSSASTTTITINNSRWSTVLYNQGALGAGTQAPVSLGGGVVLIRTNLSIAGLDLRTLGTADNFTLTVSSTSTLAHMKSWSIRVQGRTAFDSADADRDSVADGGEGFRLGTLPFVSDPDNDLITDREDQRPFTPDSPPSITRIRATGGNWQTSVSFDTTARYGVKDVKVILQGTDGSSRLLIPKKTNGNSWQVDLPVAPTSLRIGANDTYNSYTEVTLPYAGGSATPTSVSVRLGTWTGGSLLNQRSTMSASIVVTVAEAIFIVLVVGMMALAHIIAREGSNGNGENNPKVLDEVVLPSSAVGPAWVIEPGKLGCVRSVSLLYGYGGAAADAAHRGAYGITRDHPDYANAQQVYNTIDTAMATSSNRFVIQDTPHTGAIVAYNANKGVWQKWTVSLDPITCTGEVVREQRQKWDEDLKNLMAAVITIAGGGALVMASTLIRGNWEDWRDERTDRVRLMDAKKNHSVVFEFSTYFADDITGGANRNLHHSLNPAKDMGNIEVQMMWFAWQKAAVFPTVKPTWYWQERASLRDLTHLTPRGDALLDIVHTVTPPAFKDQAAGTLAVEADVLEAIRRSEDAICAFRSVDGTPRNAFLPVGRVDIQAQDIVKVHMDIHVAGSPAEFYRGPC